MGMPDLLTPTYWTAEMVRALPEDGQRYEVVYGELLVTPAPRLWHQVLVNRLSFALAEYLRSDADAMVLTAPADISWDRDVLVQPDVFVVPLEQARQMDWTAIRDLLLVAEVLSPLRDLDKWIRRKLRCYHWKQWGRAGYRELRRRGVSVREAWNTSKSAHGPWRLSKTPALALALPARYFSSMGLPSLAA